MRPIRLTRSDKNALPDVNKKLRGQVIVYNKDCPLKDITVVVEAKKDGAETFQIVGSAKTDNSGNFFMPYPFGRYTDAQAIVSLTPNDPVSIPVLANDDTNQTISDDFLFLLVTDANCPPKNEEDDCDCHSPKKAPRLPDHDDLIKSDEYSQDLGGGGCINLSTPNRTLSEYNYQGVVRTSDPDVANYTLTKTTKSAFNAAYIDSVHKFLSGSGTESPIDTSFTLTRSAGKIERKPVDLDNEIKWQDDPGDNKNLQLYQAVTIATGHILHYKSKFKADGYSLGDLLYSLALAPGQKKEIVVFDATHTLLGSETQKSTQQESLAASLLNERNLTDQLGGNLNEALQGQSTSTTGGISAGGGLGYSYGGFGASLGVSGGSSTTDASASQNSSKDVSQFFDEKLKQSIIQNSESFRQLNSSVVTTVKENQTYSATTEVVANHNHCHALTILYFEVLRHFAVYQELASVEECVFVPFLMTNFTTENIYKWRDVLAPHLLPMPSNTYLSVAGFGGGSQHPLLKAFDANERIKTNYANVDFPAGSYDDEPISNIKAYVDVRVNLEQPRTLYDRIKTFPFISTETDIGDFLRRLGDGLFGKDSTKHPDMNEYVKVDPNFSSVPPKDCVRIVKFDQVLLDSSLTTNEKTLWGAYAKLLGNSTGSDIDNIAKTLNGYFFGRLISEWDDIFSNKMAPDLFRAIIGNIHFQKMVNGGSIGGNFSTSVKYTGGERIMKLNMDGKTSLKRNEFDKFITLAADGNTMNDLNNLVLLNVETVQIYYSTPHYNGTLFSGYSGDNLLDGTGLSIPENSDEKRNPRKEDIFLVNKLIEHLNSNLEYYNKILWYRLDPDRRYMLLDGFNIELFNDLGGKVAARSLASVVKNQLITVAGNSLVFPVAAGYRVSNSFISEVAPNGNLEVAATLLDHYKPLTPIDPYRISVPTRGVFAETLQSYCNACEKIEADNRLQDWNKFPNTDEPTPFAPVTTPTPTVTDWKAVFKDFAPPMVNIQNAPALPTPGAGLSGPSELLGKSGIFKDVTGLDATQQAALKTYLSNQDNAKDFAEMAKELAMQDHNTQHSDRISDSLKSAKDSGAINQEEYNKLTKQHLQNVIDGGASQNKKDASESKKAETSPIKSGVELAQMGSKVEATETDSDGNVRTLKADPSPGLQQVGDQFVRPAYTASELAGIIGEVIAQNALRTNGHIIYSDWTKHVSGTGFDFVSYNPADKSLWIIDNKAQFKGIGNANALTGARFDAYFADLKAFLTNLHPNKSEADLALKALSDKNVKLVVTNGFAGEATTFTKGLFARGLHAFDVRFQEVVGGNVRIGKLFYPNGTPVTAATPGQAEWAAEFATLTKRKGIRITLRQGAVSIAGTLLVLATVGSATYMLQSGSDIKDIAGEVVGNFAIDSLLTLLPGGFFASFAIGLESDNPAFMRAQKKQEDIDMLLDMIPDSKSFSAEEMKIARAALSDFIDNPMILPEPPPKKMKLHYGDEPTDVFHT